MRETKPMRRLSTATKRVNSSAYWENRFSSADWDAKGGREQSRVFMDLLIKHLPAAVYEDIASQGLSILDCGCAEGDGAAVLAQAFPRSRVGGFDFSPAAIERACASFSGIDFFVARFTELDRTADVLISSNCFEHLEDPISALERLIACAHRYVLLLVPFRERLPVDPEHVRIVHATTFPEVVAGWQRTHRIVLPPSPVWAQKQLLMIYKPRDLASQGLELETQGWRTVQRGIESWGSEIRALKQGLDTSHREIGKILSSGEEHIRSHHELRQALQLGLEELRLAHTQILEDFALREAKSLRAGEEQARLYKELREDLQKELREVRIAQARIAESLEVRHSEASALLGRLREEERLRQEALAETQRLSLLLKEQQYQTAHLESELGKIHRSRLWRLGHAYWALRRRLRWRSPLPVFDLPGAETTSQPTATEPSHDGTLAHEDKAVGPTPLEAGERLSGLASLPGGRFDVIVFSIIDWDFRFQRPQQLAAQFGRHGHRVFYLSTTRFLPIDGPAWDLSPKSEGVAELAIRSLRPLDIYGGRLEETDLGALESAFGELLERFALGDTVCLLQIPFWAPLAERLRDLYGWHVVYDCMDEWSNFPGIGRAVLELEADLVRNSDVTIATAHLLHERLSGQAKRLVLIQNAVDLEHYGSRYGANTILADVRHPVIGYFGALASWVDAELLEMIALRFPHTTLVLAGGVFDIDLSRIEALPNVRLLGQRPYEEMPLLLWHFDLCIIPFLVNDITEATNPVKFYEYFSAGKPVVAPRLRELLPYQEFCYLAESRSGFLERIEDALLEKPDDPIRERRRMIAAVNDWRDRYASLVTALSETYPLVSVIVVCYGGLELTRQCLDSVLDGETWPRLELLVVDNASPDGTAAYLISKFGSHSRVRILLQERNLGFAAANNLAIAKAQGEVILLLNNDTVVPAGLIGRLVRALNDSTIGLACASTNFCGNEARVEPDYQNLAKMPRFAARRAREQAGRLLDLSMAAMYCVATRREVIERVGLLEESFGIGMFEDDDYSLRMHRAGYRVVCVEDAYVHHVGQAAFGSLSVDQYKALWERNQALFERKWGIPWKPHATRAGVAPPLSRVGDAG